MTFPMPDKAVIKVMTEKIMLVASSNQSGNDIKSSIAGSYWLAAKA